VSVLRCVSSWVARSFSLNLWGKRVSRGMCPGFSLMRAFFKFSWPHKSRFSTTSYAGHRDKCIVSRQRCSGPAFLYKYSLSVLSTSEYFHQQSQPAAPRSARIYRITLDHCEWAITLTSVSSLGVISRINISFCDFKIVLFSRPLSLDVPAALNTVDPVTILCFLSAFLERAQRNV